MEEFKLFLLTFIFVFLIYEIFIVSRSKRKRKKKDKKYKDPMEVKYLVNVYKLDLGKINYNRLLHVIAIVSSFDISCVVSISLMFHVFVLEIIVGFLSLLAFIVVSYHIIYLFYKRGGLIKND